MPKRRDETRIAGSGKGRGAGAPRKKTADVKTAEPDRKKQNEKERRTAHPYGPIGGGIRRRRMQETEKTDAAMPEEKKKEGGEKALVLFSGGVDSTTCLGLAISRYGKENVSALSVRYGQKHEKEIGAAEKIAEYYGVELTELDLTPIFRYSDCSLLKQSDEEIPKESYAEQISHTGGRPVSTYVPFRNGLFLASAASIALSKNCGVILYGAHGDDAAGNAYPDCSREFQEAMDRAVFEGSGHALHIEAPFVGMTKADVVRTGLELGVPYGLTWSCYEGRDRPCGVCGTCIDRARAFEANGVRDPAMEEGEGKTRHSVENRFNRK